MAIEALAICARIRSHDLPLDLDAALEKGARWLIVKVESGERVHPSPIGFYFAKLWYHERLYPIFYTVGALGALVRRIVD